MVLWATADNALKRAQDAEKELNKAMGEVDNLFQKVSLMSGPGLMVAKCFWQYCYKNDW